MIIKNKFKNKLFHLIRELDFTPDEFELDEKVEEGGLVIIYNNTSLKFTIRTSPDEFDKFDSNYTTYSPIYKETEYYPLDIYGDFDYVLENFKTWIENEVKKFIEGQEDEEDLWSEYKNGSQSFNFEEISFDNKSSFTFNEQKQIGIAINELKFLIQTNIANSKQEQKIISDRLDYLVENVERLNKFEWKSLLLSTLISLSMTLSLDVEKGQMLFEYLKRVFSTFPKLLS